MCQVPVAEGDFVFACARPDAVVSGSNELCPDDCVVGHVDSLSAFLAVAEPAKLACRSGVISSCARPHASGTRGTGSICHGKPSNGRPVGQRLAMSPMRAGCIS
eukprot:3934001-Rhodomonas_salina.2